MQNNFIDPGGGPPSSFLDLLIKIAFAVVLAVGLFLRRSADRWGRAHKFSPKVLLFVYGTYAVAVITVLLFVWWRANS